MNLNMSRYTRKTMFMKLIAYFVLIIIITLSASSYFMYTYFSSSFKNEISEFNHKVLNHVSIISDEFLLKSVNEFTINQIMNTNKTPELKAIYTEDSIDDWKIIFDAQYKLAGLVIQRRDIVDSIFVHSRINHVLVSSSTNIVKNIDEKEITATDEFSWLNTFYKSNKSILWLKTRNANLYTNGAELKDDVITVICSYPISSVGDAVKGLIAVNIRESALSNYLVKFNSDNSGQIMILDSNGTIVSHSNKSCLYNNISNEAFVKTILGSTSQKDFKTNYNNTEYVVSYVKSSFNNWYYVSLVPTELFYQKSGFIKKNILIVSLIILIIAFILSDKLSLNIYTPFKNILEKYSTASGTSCTPKRGITEYHLLDNLFSNMFTKLSDMQATLNKNSLMIRHNLLVDLLNNHFSAPDNLENMLMLINLELANKYNCVVIFTNVNKTNDLLQSGVLYKYNIIDFIDSISCSNCMYIPVDTGNETICVIVNTNSNQNTDIVQFVHQVQSYCHEKLDLQIVTSTGRFTEDLLSINKSYIDAKICLQYKFIYTDKTEFYYNETEITSNSIPGEILKRFNKNLKLGIYSEVKETMNAFTDTVINDKIPYREVRRTILNFTSFYTQFLEIMNIKYDEIICEQDRKTLHSPKNLDEYVLTLLKAVQTTSDFIHSKKLSKNIDITNKIKQYVLDNLDQEISLNSTAEVFHLSSFHLSKLFKEETGINFIDYIMTCKMDKAKNLLVSTNYTIDKITSLIGYSHATYFSRKFKELTGKTPNAYRSDAYLQL